MVSLRRLGFIALLPALLSCTAHVGAPDICSAPPPLISPISAMGAGSLAEAPNNAADCIHRWAYRLAGSTENAQSVSIAVLGACRDPIGRWAEWRESIGTPTADGTARLYPSAETGQPTTPQRSVFEDARSIALFRVIQARVGRCKVP